MGRAAPAAGAGLDGSIGLRVWREGEDCPDVVHLSVPQRPAALVR